MPAAMPYHLETGVAFQLIEMFLNGVAADGTPEKYPLNPPHAGTAKPYASRREKLFAVRGDLVGGQRRLDELLAAWIPQFAASAKGAVSAATPRTWAAEVRRRFFGNKSAEGSPPAARYDYLAESGRGADERGAWRFYSGEAEKILRETFRQAIDVALGISPTGSVADARPGDPWKLMILWKCAQPWLEGWIQWRSDPGIVVVIICTPGDGERIALDPDLSWTRERHESGYWHHPQKPQHAPPYASVRPQGSMVVTHDAHRFSPLVATKVTTTVERTAQLLKPGAPDLGAPLPWFGGAFEGVDGVVTVSPAVDDGGVWYGKNPQPEGQSS